MAAKTSSGGWKPGQSGNPGGRKRGVDLDTVLAKIGCTRLGVASTAWEQLIAIVEDGGKNFDRSTYRWALETQLHYTLGRPTERMELAVEQSSPSAVKWAAVPLADRRKLLEAAQALGALSEPDEAGDGTTEH